MSEHTKDELYAQLSELIGEMSWGIGLPRVMTVAIKESHDSPVKLIDVSAEHSQPYFEAIYKNMKSNKKYNPLRNAMQKVEQLQSANAELVEALEAIVRAPVQGHGAFEVYARAVAKQALAKHKQSGVGNV